MAKARRAHLEQRAGVAADLALVPGSIVAVFSAKGGVGCTTVATNLALGLANASSARVTLVDMHLAFGDVALAFNLQPARSIVDALNEGVLDDAEQLRAQLTEVSQDLGDLAILAAPPASWPGRPIEPTRITRLLRQLAAISQFVVVDTSTVSAEAMAAVLDTAELALLVVTPEVPVLYHSRRLLTSLDELTFPVDRIQVVLNRAGSRTGVTTAQAQDHLGRKLEWKISNDHTAMQATALGAPVIVTQPRSRVAVDIKRIVAYLAGPSSSPSRFHWRFWLG